MRSIISNKFLWIIVVITIMVFSNTTQNGFVWDDHAFVENQQLAGWSAFKGALEATYPVVGSNTYRPVRNVAYVLTNSLFGDKSVSHHFLIVSLHVICIILVHELIKILIKNELAVFLSTLVFALHPIHTENIYWVTAGYDLIFVVFFLLTLITHITHFHQSKNNKYLSYFFATLAIFTNESALILPVLIMTVDNLWFKIRIFKKENFTRYLIYFLIAGIFLLVRMSFLGSSDFNNRVYESPVEEIKLAVVLFGHYIKQLHLPEPLTVDHLFQSGLTGLQSQNHSLIEATPPINFSQPKIYTALLFFIGWLIITIYSLMIKNKLAVPLLWIFLGLLAVLRVIPLPVTYSERYAYVSSIGFSIAIATLVNQFNHKKILQQFFVGTLSLLVIYFAIVSNQAGLVWNSDFSLWNHAMKENKESAAAVSALGVHFFLENNLDKSFEYHQLAAQMNPFVVSYQQNYISSLVRQKRYLEVIEFIEIIIKTDPSNVDLYTLQASAYDGIGNYQKAMEKYQIAYNLTPKNTQKSQQIKDLVNALDQKYQIVDLE